MQTMKSFRALLLASLTMLGRNRVLIIASLGLALISIFAFGALFGSSGSAKLQLGVVDQDASPLSSQFANQLKSNASIRLHTGDQAGEVAALRAGNRDAVLVIPAGFAAGLAQNQTSLSVYYNQSNPVTQAAARGAVESLVANLNTQTTGRPSTVRLNELAVSVHGLTEVGWLTPGMLGMMLMWANLSVGAALVQWRKQGILRRLAATPLRPSVLITTQILSRVLLSVAQAAVLLGVAVAVFHIQIVGAVWLVALVVAFGAMAMLSIGFVIGSFASNQDMANALTYLVSFPMMFLSGTYFPTTSAPAFLTPIINALPLTYLNDALRGVINNGVSLHAISTDLVVLVAWTVIALLASVRAFRWA